MAQQLTALVTTLTKELRTIYVGPSYLFKIFGDVTRTAVLAWIVYLSGDLQLMGYLCVGAAFFAMWTGMVAMGGWSLSSEIYAKTLDFVLLSPSAMPLVLFGKTLAQMIYELIAAVFALITMFAIIRGVPRIGDPVCFGISIAIALVGLAALGFFFAPLVVLAGGRPGFFMGIVPFGALLSGLIIPVSHLTPLLRGTSSILPVSWAMTGVWISISGKGVIFTLLPYWAIAIALSVLWFFGTWQMCLLVENKIRKSGTLGAV